MWKGLDYSGLQGWVMYPQRRGTRPDIWPLRVDTRTSLENLVKNDYIFSSLAMSKDVSLPMEFSGRLALERPAGERKDIHEHSMRGQMT